MSVRRVMRKLLGKTDKRPTTLIPSEYIALLLDCVSRAISVPGDIIEVGTYKGGSLYRMAEHIKKSHHREFEGRRLIGIDTFKGHPYSDPEKDPEHHPEGRFSDTSYEEVKKAMKEFEFVDLVKGECGEAFGKLGDRKYCLAHVDVDIAKSAELSVEYIYPRLSPGGIVLFDEYEGYGQKDFIDRYFADKPVILQPRESRTDDNYGLIVFKTLSQDI